MLGDLLRLQPWLAVVAAALVLSTPPAGACLRSEGVQCPEDFKSFNAVTWAGDDFALAGVPKTPTGLTVLYVSGDGHLRRNLPIPWPEDVSDYANISANVRKLISLPNKTLVLIANIQTKEPTKYIGWVVGVPADGKIWNRVFTDDVADVILHSAYYEAKKDRLIVAGRRQVGSDTPPCGNWSQSYIQGMETIELSPEETATLIDYARRKYAEERYPLSTELREVRTALLNLRPQPAEPPAAPARPYEPSMLAQKKRRR